MLKKYGKNKNGQEEKLPIFSHLKKSVVCQKMKCMKNKK